MRSFLLGGLPKQSTQSRPLSADYPYSYPEYESDPGLFAPISSDGATDGNGIISCSLRLACWDWFSAPWPGARRFPDTDRLDCWIRRYRLSGCKASAVVFPGGRLDLEDLAGMIFPVALTNRRLIIKEELMRRFSTGLGCHQINDIFTIE